MTDTEKLIAAIRVITEHYGTMNADRREMMDEVEEAREDLSTANQEINRLKQTRYDNDSFQRKLEILKSELDDYEERRHAAKQLLYRVHTSMGVRVRENGDVPDQWHEDLGLALDVINRNVDVPEEFKQ